MASKVILMLLVIQITQKRARTISMAHSRAKETRVRVVRFFMGNSSFSFMRQNAALVRGKQDGDARAHPNRARQQASRFLIAMRQRDAAHALPENSFHPVNNSPSHRY